MNEIQCIVPDKFGKYFWDCDFKQLNLKKHKKYIINKLMQYGNLEAIFWIFDNIKQNVVENYMTDNGEQKIGRKSYLFWTKVVKMDQLWKMK